MLLGIAPWHLSPNVALMAAPEYLFGEYVFLVCVLALGTQWRRVGVRPSLSGALAAIGVATKISMLGAAIFLFVTFTRHDRRAARFVFASALTYIGICVMYASFDRSCLRHPALSGRVLSVPQRLAHLCRCQRRPRRQSAGDVGSGGWRPHHAHGAHEHVDQDRNHPLGRASGLSDRITPA
jgi:hypothetical protein